MSRAGTFIALLLIASAAIADEATVFRHPGDTWYWIAGQMNVIHQRHGRFTSPYSGQNSLRDSAESATSDLITLYTGVQLPRHQELLADIESAGGRGISDALGLAGFTNLDVVRNPSLGSKPYLARLMYHATIPLSADVEPQDRSMLSIATQVPVRRIDIHAGKMSAVDFFDVNGAGSDSHLQFMNWTVDNNGAFDYAADTRGYTWGAVVELHEPSWSLRGGLMLMPTVANGIELDHSVRRARGMNLEYELRRPLVPNRSSVLRLLVFENIAGMGNYRDSNALARLAGKTPDITATRRQGRTKYGVGVNVEQEIAGGVRLFSRLGWGDGRNESYAYTEVDRTVEVGFDAFVSHRRQDKIGVAIVSNGIVAAHRAYLAAGGVGFLLGDGSLRYGPELIVEAYYTAKVAAGVHLSIDVHHINNPGYNRDRGPVWVESARFHVDF